MTRTHTHAHAHHFAELSTSTRLVSTQAHFSSVTTYKLKCLQAKSNVDQFSRLFGGCSCRPYNNTPGEKKVIKNGVKHNVPNTDVIVSFIAVFRRRKSSLIFQWRLPVGHDKLSILHKPLEFVMGNRCTLALRSFANVA